MRLPWVCETDVLRESFAYGIVTFASSWANVIYLIGDVMDFEKLTSNKLVNLGRAANMLWLNIGNPCTIELPRINGTVIKREVTDYAIHLQCAWRFVKRGKVLLASGDIYDPYDENLDYDNDWAWDIIGRADEQSSIFDVLSKKFIKEFLPMKIKNIFYTDTHDLHIDFDKDVYFDTFIDWSRRDEFYRFLDNITGKHTVIFDVD